MFQPIKPTLGRMAEAVRLLEAGHVIGLPTETVYGLAADATNDNAVARIFQIKGRPSDHPLILHLGDASWLDQWASDIPESARILAKAFWPGPLTLVLKRGPRVLLSVTGGLETVAVRVPAHPVAQALLRKFKRPLAAPSANRFGSVSPTTREHVLADLGKDVPLVLEGGPSTVGLESTIVDLTGAEPRLLRPGGISLEQLQAALGQRVLPGDGTVRAPGTLESHYAPSVPVELVPASELWTEVLSVAQRERVGALTELEPPGDLPTNVQWVRMSPEPAEQARVLYASLRQLDESGVARILTSLPPAVGLGAAIADRLKRASSPREPV